MLQQIQLLDHCLAKRTLVYLECPAKVSSCGYRCAARLRRGLPLALSINVPYVSVPTAVFKSATISDSMLQNESSSLILSIVGLIRYTLPSSVRMVTGNGCSVPVISPGALTAFTSGQVLGVSL